MGYPSDLSDNEWRIVSTLLPTRKQRGFKRKYSERELLNAIFYLNKTGCQWRYLPSDLPPWQSVHRYFVKLSDNNTFAKINQALCKKVRKAVGRNQDPSLVCIDSQSVKAETNLEERGIDGNKKVKGRKRHIVVDVLGLLILVSVTAANISDIHPGKEFIDEMKNHPRVEKILVDKGYQGLQGNYGNLAVEISSKKPDQIGFVPLHKRWVVERTFSWLLRQRRVAKDYESRVDLQESMIYLAMSRIMLRRLA